MTEDPNKAKIYDLEERTFAFAKSVALFLRKIPKTADAIEYGRQLIRSSASIGANYIEANEALSKKDFLFRIRIARKEARETAYWLRLFRETARDDFQREAAGLSRGAIELKKIFSSILGH